MELKKMLKSELIEEIEYFQNLLEKKGKLEENEYKLHIEKNKLYSVI